MKHPSDMIMRRARKYRLKLAGGMMPADTRLSLHALSANMLSLQTDGFGLQHFHKDKAR
jgi:hypothetical protein